MVPGLGTAAWLRPAVAKLQEWEKAALRGGRCSGSAEISEEGPCGLFGTSCSINKDKSPAVLGLVWGFVKLSSV